MQNAKTQALREQIARLVDEYAAIALAPQPFLPGASVVKNRLNEERSGV